MYISMMIRPREEVTTSPLTDPSSFAIKFYERIQMHSENIAEDCWASLRLLRLEEGSTPATGRFALVEHTALIDHLTRLNEEALNDLRTDRSLSPSDPPREALTRLERDVFCKQIDLARATKAFHTATRDSERTQFESYYGPLTSLSGRVTEAKFECYSQFKEWGLAAQTLSTFEIPDAVRPLYNRLFNDLLREGDCTTLRALHTDVSRAEQYQTPSYQHLCNGILPKLTNAENLQSITQLLSADRPSTANYREAGRLASAIVLPRNQSPLYSDSNQAYNLILNQLRAQNSWAVADEIGATIANAIIRKNFFETIALHWLARTSSQQLSRTPLSDEMRQTMILSLIEQVRLNLINNTGRAPLLAEKLRSLLQVPSPLSASADIERARALTEEILPVESTALASTTSSSEDTPFSLSAFFQEKLEQLCFTLNQLWDSLLACFRSAPQ